MKNILLTIAGILFFAGAYYFGFAKTYVIYRAYPNAYHPIEVKGVGSYMQFSNIVSLISKPYLKQQSLKDLIVTFQSGPNEKGKIEYAFAKKASLTQGYFPLAGHAKMFAFLTLILSVIGGWLLRLSFKKE